MLLAAGHGRSSQFRHSGRRCFGSASWSSDLTAACNQERENKTRPKRAHVVDQWCFGVPLYTAQYRARSLPHQSLRPMSSSWIPDVVSNFSIWGGSGFVLKTLHCNGTVPYWACMSLTNVIVRVGLLPLVVQGAHTNAKFAAVAPEVQFLLTLFQQDRAAMAARKEIPEVRRQHLVSTLRSLRHVYRVHGIHPLSVLKAPLLQIPIFWYFASDVRRIINGSDVPLARDLQDGGMLWFLDLTEPDPFFVFPILTGALLYINVEFAMGKKSLSGETTSKANIARGIKDFFQSIAILMPCFMSSSPAGVQIYLATSFLFTLGQSAALRSETCRSYVGLPSMETKPPEPLLASKFRKMKEKQHEAAEKRGGGEVLGKGVLAPGWTSSFAGTSRESTIPGGASTENKSSGGNSFMEKESSGKMTHMPFVPEEAMEAANRGDKNFALYKRQVLSLDAEEDKPASIAEKRSGIEVKKLKDRRRIENKTSPVAALKGRRAAKSMKKTKKR